MAEPTIVAEPGVPQIVLTTELDAPRGLVFKAFTDPDLLAQWLAPQRRNAKIDEYDPRPGGRWHFVHVDDDGAEHELRGVFHRTPSLRRGVVRTVESDGAPGRVALETTTFGERQGERTLLRQSLVCQSIEARDDMLRDLRDEATDALVRLQELVERWAVRQVAQPGRPLQAA